MLPKIALISAASSFENIAPILPEFEDRCQIEVFCYEQLGDVVKLYNDCKDSFDGFMFSGWLPYSMVEGICRDNGKPHRYFNISEGDFFRVMFKISVEHPGIDYRRVMVDDPQLDLDLSEIFEPGRECMITSFYPLEYAMQCISQESHSADISSIYTAALDAYRSAWRANNIDVVVTRLTNIGRILKEENIAYYVLAPSKATMCDCMERLINLVNSGHTIDMLSVYGILEWDADDLQEARQSLYTAISLFNKRNGSSLLLSIKENSVHISTTNIYFRKLTNRLKSCKLSEFLKEETSFSFNLGWGVGCDIVQAKQNAAKAIKLARHRGKDSTFAVDEKGYVVGPLLSQVCLKYSDETPQEIIDLSNRYDISRIHVKQILSLIKQQNKNIFTSEELAEGLGISQRSARRILAKLYSNGGAIRLEDNETGLRGRPSLRYSISLTL